LALADELGERERTQRHVRIVLAAFRRGQAGGDGHVFSGTIQGAFRREGS
jgi:hypothetical protein